MVALLVVNSYWLLVLAVAMPMASVMALHLLMDMTWARLLDTTLTSVLDSLQKQTFSGHHRRIGLQYELPYICDWILIVYVELHVLLLLLHN